jgi:hypothetical protein
MGFNLFGFLIKTSVQDKTVFEQSLNLELKDAGLTFLEDAMLNKYGSPYFDVYKTDNGTIIFCDDSYYDNDPGLAKLSLEADVITFNMSETSMGFFFKQFSNGALQWEEGILFEETIRRMGEDHLQITDKTDVVFDTFAKITTEYLGINIHQVDPAEEVRRYHATKTMAQAAIEEADEYPLQTKAGPGHTTKNDNTPKAPDVFWLFWQFTGEIYKKNKKTIIRETNDSRFFSFESYLRSQVAPDMVEPYCQYMKDHFPEYEAWQKQKVDEVNQSKAGKKKTSRAAAAVKIISFVVIVFSCVYGLVGLLLKPFGVSIWNWTGYLSVFAGIILLVVLWMVFKIIQAMSGRKKGTIVYFDKEVP